MKQELRKITSINKILTAAEEFIQKKGIEAIDIDEISRSAGLTKGAFYHHFKSKQHLLLELFNRWISNIANKLEISPPFGKTATEIIVDIVDKIQPAFEQYDKELPAFLELYLRAINDKDIKKPVMKSYKNFLAFFSQMLAIEAIQSPAKPATDKENPEDIARILFALTIGLVIQGLMNPKGTNWNELAKKSVKMVLGNKTSK
ncbi:MAG: TetR/AcrR family transcriptional regulator [Actinobacteria bacterium]|nr:TetR/AcrR family transcriptional regulator [Actinomycetota bacterium]